jgi:hypothetical protein
MKQQQSKTPRGPKTEKTANLLSSSKGRVESTVVFRDFIKPCASNVAILTIMGDPLGMFE